MKQIISSLLQICLFTLGYLYTTTKATPAQQRDWTPLGDLAVPHAQVTPDNTVNTQVERSGNVSEITGGATRGDNLFHSFEQFSIPNGNEAFFNNANAIQNIFSRVTGGSISEINGLIRANGGANLFLINPAGIIFGENASLKLGGSFYGSSASSIIFPNGEFSAIAPETESILTISVPIGLSFEDNPEPIVNRSVAGLEVAVGEELFLVGGNIDFPGGKIFAPGGDVELGGLAAAGDIGIDADGSLSFPNAIEKADVTLSNAAEVNVRSGGGGNITVNADNLDLTESGLLAGIAIDSGSTDTQAGDITLNATDTINISQGSFISNTVLSTGVGNAGNINITANNLNLTEGSGISASTFGKGDAGATKIDVSGTTLVDGEDSDGIGSSIYSWTSGDGVGNSGDIEINTGNLFLNGGGTIETVTFREGNVGKITINVLDTISAEGETQEGVFKSGIFSRINSTATGDSEGIEITTANLSLNEGGAVISNIRGQGNAGLIKVNASDTISIQGETQFNTSSRIANQVNSGGVGNSKGIEITTANLSLIEGGRIDASIFGEGNAGAIVINASENIFVRGETTIGDTSGVFSQVTSGVGNSGGINLTASNLSLIQGGAVVAGTFGQGNAGKIEINVSGTISIEGTSQSGFTSKISNQVNSGGVGNSGGINLTTSNLFLTQGGSISASTLGQGNAGAIVINASDTVSVRGESKDGDISGITSSVEETGVGDSGDINLTVANLSLIGGGQVVANTSGKGNTGLVKIDASDTISVEGESDSIDRESGRRFQSTIFSRVDDKGIGDSEGIDITTYNLSVAQGGEINASTFGEGNAGKIKINASETILVEGIKSGIGSIVGIPGVGDSGGIDITTSNLSLIEGGSVDANTFGQGNAGTIKINASDSVEIIGQNGSVSGIFSGVAGVIDNQTGEVFRAVGNSGGIEITTNQLLIQDGQINASTFGRGNAGTIKINASDTVSIDGSISFSGIGSVVGDTGIGNAGGITIETNNLSLTNNAGISVQSLGQGNAADLDITANSLALDNEAFLAASTPVGTGGNITLGIADRLTLSNNSIISARAFEDANGGNIDIDAEFIFASPNQDNNILASADRGRGGNIRIASEGIFGLEERSSTPDNNTNDLDASSRLGIDGTVQINTPEVNLQKELEQLEGELVSTEAIIANSCLSRSSQRSSFTLGGYAGLPKSPDSNYSDLNFSLTGIGSFPAVEQPESTQSNYWQQIAIPASKMVTTEDGRVFLVAAPQKAESLFCQS